MTGDESPRPVPFHAPVCAVLRGVVHSGTFESPPSPLLSPRLHSPPAASPAPFPAPGPHEPLQAPLSRLGATGPASEETEPVQEGPDPRTRCLTLILPRGSWNLGAVWGQEHVPLRAGLDIQEWRAAVLGARKSREVVGWGEGTAAGRRGAEGKSCPEETRVLVGFCCCCKLS